MIKYFFYLIEIIKNYHFYSFLVLVYEIFFNIRYGIRFNKFTYYKNDSSTDPVPCCYYFIRKINIFFKKNKINKICDLGSGYGKMIFYFGKIKKLKIDGVELNKEIFDSTYFLCDENIQTIEEMDSWLEKNQVKYKEITNSEEMAKSRIGEKLYNKFLSSI